jgi:hypothetical protein
MEMRVGSLTREDLTELLKRAGDGTMQRDIVVATLKDTEEQFHQRRVALGRDAPGEIYNALMALCNNVQEALLDIDKHSRLAQKLACLELAIDLGVLRQFLRLKYSGREFQTLEEAISTVFREERARVMDTHKENVSNEQ